MAKQKNAVVSEKPALKLTSDWFCFGIVVTVAFLIRLVYLLVSRGEFWFDWVFVDSGHPDYWVNLRITYLWLG